jgi:hypothetical protein
VSPRREELTYRFELIGEQHAAIFLYDLVDDEHDQLAQCRRRRGRYHRRPRFMQLETQKEGLFRSVCPSVHPSIKRRGSTEQKHVLLPAMNGGEVGDKGKKSQEDLELYVDTLGDAVIHCVNDGWDRREGDGAQGDEALEVMTVEAD